MKRLTEEEVFNLRLNIHSYIWTTGFLELDLDEKYITPFGTLECSPGIGWHFSGTFKSRESNVPGVTYISSEYLLTDFLKDHNIKYDFICPILRKLHKKRTDEKVFKILGFPHGVKCWF